MIQKKQKIKYLLGESDLKLNLSLNLIYKCKWLCFSLINLPNIV